MWLGRAEVGRQLFNVASLVPVKFASWLLLHVVLNGPPLPGAGLQDQQVAEVNVCRHHLHTASRRSIYERLILRETPCLLLHVGDLVAVEELRKAADLIVHHTASVIPSAAQGAQEQLTLFGVTS